MRKEAKDQKEREAHAGKYVSVQTSSKKRRRDRGDNDEDDEEDAIVSRKDDFSPEILAALKSVLDLDPTNTGACQAAMRSHRSRFLENDVLSPPSFESWDAFRDGCDTACTEYDMREAERVELEAHTNAGVDDSDDDDDDDDGGSVRTSDAEFLTDDEDQGERVVLVESDSDDDDDEDAPRHGVPERMACRLLIASGEDVWRARRVEHWGAPTTMDIMRFDQARKEEPKKMKKKKKSKPAS